MAKLLIYNKSLSRIETENTNSVKYDLSLSANGMVNHIGVCAEVCNIAGLSNKKIKVSMKSLKKSMQNSKELRPSLYTELLSNTFFQHALACIG